MRCHYEVLGVSQRATDIDLKKAYRQMALVWHPDKNPDNMEEAKIQFQLIQAAYETLSDPQERAFYDRNRDSILRGKGSGSDPTPETVNLFEFFSSQCYSGFNDSEKDFYTVYRQVFEMIAVKDMQYMNDEEDIIIPNFGSSDMDLEDVAAFYGYWSGYCTSMDFHWADEYDIREAQRMGRWVEKKIEKDNNKARQKARKQFNEEVRALVAFVRKRDKRWLARKKMIDAKIAENARKQEACQRRQREARQMMMKANVEQEKANLAAYEDQLKVMEEKMAEEWGLTESNSECIDEEEEEDETAQGSEDDFPPDSLYCVACNKSFKTEKSMESHERSKKHRENLEQLKVTMLADDETYIKANVPDSKISNDDSQTEEDLTPMPKSSKKKKKKRKSTVAEDPTSPPTSEYVEKRRKSKKKNRQGVHDVEVNIRNSGEESEREPESSQVITNGHDNKSKEDKEFPVNEECEEEEIDCKKLEKDEAETLPSIGGENHKTSNSHQVEEAEKNDLTVRKPKLKGKKAKEARKQAQESSDYAGPDVQVNRCSVCGSVYSSKNKLFTHIKAEGHAVLKTCAKDVKGKNKAKK